MERFLPHAVQLLGGHEQSDQRRRRSPIIVRAAAGKLYSRIAFGWRGGTPSRSACPNRERRPSGCAAVRRNHDGAFLDSHLIGRMPPTISRMAPDAFSACRSAICFMTSCAAGRTSSGSLFGLLLRQHEGLIWRKRRRFCSAPHRAMVLAPFALGLGDNHGAQSSRNQEIEAQGL